MSLIAAALLVCSHGDRDVAADVVAQAVQQNVPAELALAVACVESGLTAPNPMGVRDCYRTGKFDNYACIVIGVRSLANRLRGCGGNVECAAKRYHGTRHANAAKYAAKVARIVRFLRGRK